MGSVRSWFETALTRLLTMRGSSPLLLIGLEVGVGDAQPRHWYLRGITARDQIADHVIGFDRRARLDVAEHRRGQLRPFCGQHALCALQKWGARCVARGGRDPAAFI